MRILFFQIQWLNSMVILETFENEITTILNQKSPFWIQKQM